MNQLVTIFIDGDWETSHEDKTDKSPIRIFDKGQVVTILAEQYNQYINDLEDRGFDCYICLEKYSHPQWNGEIIFMCKNQKSITVMTKEEKAIAYFLERGIEASKSNGGVSIITPDENKFSILISDEEIDYRAELFDATKECED